MSALVASAMHLSKVVSALSFAEPVAHVYNPLEYAFGAHCEYLERFGAVPKEVVFVGMNPGPWGMAQTGVPFGEISAVRDWMGIVSGVGKPASEHPKRPIEGFDCNRSEVSGRRLWGWARERFGSPERFFERFLVANYCPLDVHGGVRQKSHPGQAPGQSSARRSSRPATRPCGRWSRPSSRNGSWVSASSPSSGPKARWRVSMCASVAASTPRPPARRPTGAGPSSGSVIWRRSGSAFRGRPRLAGLR